MLALILAVGLAALSCAAGELLSHGKALDIYALVLIASAGAYLGVALNAGGRNNIALELVAALGFGAAAYFGMGKWPILLVIGFAVHAVWHLLHYSGSVGARVKPGYAFAGIIYDAILAAYIYLRILH